MSDDALTEGILDAQNGAAICFLGAGFSLDARTALGGSIPSVSELSADIWDIIGDTPIANASLADLADFCEQDDEKSGRLRDLLIKKFTLCQPTEQQRTIINLPWRAIFTTNFDDVAESASNDTQIVTPSFNAKNLNPQKRPIYYLHGRARDLLEQPLDPALVLSELSYLQIKDRNRDLYAALENEVHVASRIFFIGYSLRDADIASMLFSIPGLRSKSLVIVSSTESQFFISRLRKFGDVCSVGVSGLASRIAEMETQRPSVPTVERLSFVERMAPARIADEVSPDDVHRLILSGEFSLSAFARQMADASNSSPYCVARNKHVETVFSSVEGGINRILISSDLGNGKSTLLNEIIYAAQQRLYDVITINRQLKEVYTELTSLLSDPKRRVFIIDDLVRYKRVAQFIGVRLPANSILIASAGNISDNQEFYGISDTLGGAVREIDINTLDSSELAAWDLYLERWGYWEERIEDSPAERIDFLRERCNSENRAIVVSLFKTSALSSRIQSIVDFFLNRNKDLAKPFIAILINSLCRHHVEWSRIVDWLDINEGDLKSKILKSGVAAFIAGSRRWYDFTSAELADFILGRYDFEINDIVDVYVTIVRETAYSANDPRSGFDSRENLKELMRFRFLTRLFSNPEDGHATINAVYHRLSIVPRIRDNDQFWLQYAMARMEIGDLDTAETYINTSLGIAKKKGLDYSVTQIIDQRCRLLFRKNALRRSGYSKADITQAISDLTEALNARDAIYTHPLRAAADLLGFIEARLDDLSSETVSELRQCLALMKSRIPEGKLPKSQKGETSKIREDVKRSLLMLSAY